MEQANIQFVRQLLPNVQELADIICDATNLATPDELWSATLGRFAVVSNAWEVWWSSRTAYKTPAGVEILRLVVEASYRGTPSAGPLQRMRGMRLEHIYDASIPTTDPAAYGIREGLAWLAGVVEKSFWEMRQKIAEAEDRCIMDEAKAIQASPDGVDMQAASLSASQTNAGVLGVKNVDSLKLAGPWRAANSQIAETAKAFSNQLAQGFSSGLGPMEWEYQERIRQERMRQEMEAARYKADEIARVRYRKMTDWPGEDPVEIRRANEQAKAELEAMRQALIEQLALATPGIQRGQSPMKGVPAQQPAAPAEPEPDLTKPAKRKILAIED